MPRLGGITLFTKTPRRSREHDRFSKDQLWARIKALETALAKTGNGADISGRDAHHAGAYQYRDQFYAVRDQARAPREIRLIQFIRKDGSAEGDA
jgi:hypothetical protein